MEDRRRTINMKEKEVESILVRGVKQLGGVAYKWVSPGNVGVPDRIVVLPIGSIEFVELKTDTGRLSEVQKRQHERLKKCGVDVITLHGKEEVVTYLEKRTGEVRMALQLQEVEA